MTTYIALLRGINVGGKNRLPMKDLKALLEGLGYEHVRTYIQSGNVVFQSNKCSYGLDVAIVTAIYDAHGFKPQVMILSAEQFQTIINENPYAEAIEEPKSLHVYILKTSADAPDLERLEALKTASERFSLTNHAFYLHAPDGIGRSKLAAKVEHALGVAVTARNWRSVEKIMALARALES